MTTNAPAPLPANFCDNQVWTGMERCGRSAHGHRGWPAVWSGVGARCVIAGCVWCGTVCSMCGDRGGGGGVSPFRITLQLPIMPR
eukprot:241580-Chlamydomonas_euryale.AAC.1